MTWCMAYKRNKVENKYGVENKNILIRIMSLADCMEINDGRTENESRMQYMEIHYYYIYI